MRKLVIIALALPVIAACESTYHPEYHPVTVTEVHQSAPAQAGVTPIVVTTPPLADPSVVFQR